MRIPPGPRWTPEKIASAKKILARHSSLPNAADDIRKKFGCSINAVYHALAREGVKVGELLGKPATSKRKWNDAQIATAQKILAESFSVDEALPKIVAATGISCGADRLRKTFSSYGLPSPYSLLKKAAPAVVVDEGARLKRLVSVVGKAPLSFAELCDKLDLAPSKTRDLIEQARAQGVLVHVENDHVGLKLDEGSEEIEDLRVAPVVGKEQVIGVITDTHLGSKYCLRPQLRDFVEYAYAQGVREMLHVGDVLDGDYRHAKFEMSHVGIEDQTRDLFETLPRKKGLTYHGITGNHDHTFAASSGINVGAFMENYFRDHGREDVFFHGNRSAYLQLRGALVHLWHPKKGPAYALSYGIQKQIEKYAHIKPQILLVGHWHTFTYVIERGVHALACGTFQGGGSDFSKSLGGAPAIGGTILRWQVTKDRTIRRFNVERRAYFEREKPVMIYNDMDATPVE